MNQPSMADNAVDAIAAVRAMGEGLPIDAPERHTVRSLKRIAEDILTTAMRQARGLAYEAESLSKDMREPEKAAQEGNKP